MPKPRKRAKGRRTTLLIIPGVIIVLAAGAGFLLLSGGQQSTTSKPIILYVNQGNGIVNGSNFGALTTFAASRGFNTIFFQAYRQGALLFSTSQLASFVNQSHSSGLRIFFAFYVTNSSQTLPAAIYGLGEDGINLDMSALPLLAQQNLLANLAASFNGKTAVTTTDMNSLLKPNLLILETYGTGFQLYIKHGTIASVGVFETSSQQDYQSQFQYALQNSDGVMVFDYAGLLKRGY